MILNNGHLSESFVIKKGVRQGCPLSTSLFIICIELLSNYIKNNKHITGVTINGTEIKQTYFADDATYINNGCQNSFENLIDTLTKFSKVSGLNLNTAKSKVLRVGSLNNTNIKFCKNEKFLWTSSHASTLGMTFYNDSKLNLEKNLEPKLKEFHQCLKQWQHRKLTLMGKVTVIKTFAIPKLIYPFSVLKNPNQKDIDNIKKSIFNFVWDGKPEKIKRIQLYQSYENGGLKLTNIELFLNAIKSSWIKRYIDENNNGKYLFKKYFKNLEILFFESNIQSLDMEKIANKETFMYDVLKCWAVLHYKFSGESKRIGKQVIWNNLNKNTKYISIL